MTRGVLILGAGRHGKVIADIFRCRGTPLLGFLDDDPATWGATRLDVPILGGIDSYASYQPDGLVVGVGSIAARKRIVERLGGEVHDLWCNAIHPQAIIAASVRMGRGVVVVAGAVISPDAVVGDHTIVNTGASIGLDCVVNDHAHIGPGAHLAGGVRVGHGAFIGLGAAVIPGKCIGDGAVVGAGAVVVSDVPSYVTVKGVPARQSLPCSSI